MNCSRSGRSQGRRRPQVRGRERCRLRGGGGERRDSATETAATQRSAGTADSRRSALVIRHSITPSSRYGKPGSDHRLPRRSGNGPTSLRPTVASFTKIARRRRRRCHPFASARSCRSSGPAASAPAERRAVQASARATTAASGSQPRGRRPGRPPRPSPGRSARCRWGGPAPGRCCRAAASASATAAASSAEPSALLLSATRTLISSWGSRSMTPASSASGRPVAAMRAISWTAVSVPSPVVACRANSTWPDCSPPRTSPSRSMTSST